MGKEGPGWKGTRRRRDSWKAVGIRFEVFQNVSKLQRMQVFGEKLV